MCCHSRLSVRRPQRPMCHQCMSPRVEDWGRRMPCHVSHRIWILDLLTLLCSRRTVRVCTIKVSSEATHHPPRTTGPSQRSRNTGTASRTRPPPPGESAGMLRTAVMVCAGLASSGVPRAEQTRSCGRGGAPSTTSKLQLLTRTEERVRGASRTAHTTSPSERCSTASRSRCFACQNTARSDTRTPSAARRTPSASPSSPSHRRPWSGPDS